jgi:hypothetical protein
MIIADYTMANTYFFETLFFVDFVPHAEIRRSTKYFGCAYEICNFEIL